MGRLMCIPICCPIVSAWYVYMWCNYLFQRFMAPCCERICRVIVAYCSAVFEATVKPFCKAMGACCLWIHENILKPVYLVVVASCTWLWENVLTPICMAIGAATHGSARILESLSARQLEHVSPGYTRPLWSQFARQSWRAARGCVRL